MSHVVKSGNKKKDLHIHGSLSRIHFAISDYSTNSIFCISMQDPDEISIFKNQFKCVVEELPPNFHLEMINLQHNNMVKGKY